MKVILENIRCFAGRHVIPVSPLTILTGENSAGKSTFLAVLSAICDRYGFPLQPEFNEAPYSLGSFDTIATYKGGRYGRAETFSLGYIQDYHDKKDAVQVCATYKSSQGQVEISQASVRSPRSEIALSFEESAQIGKVELILPSDQPVRALNLPISEVRERSRAIGFGNLLFALAHQYRMEQFRKRRRDREGEAEETIDRIPRSLDQIVTALHQSYPSEATSVAPIRTRPKPTYDLEDEGFAPEGDHIPFVLRRYLTDRSSTAEQNRLQAVLERYGQDSGLFRDIKVKELGRRPGDPFQIWVKGSGRAANLPYVGYGVSQVLPVVVESVLSAPARLLLLQQPEVHLHPRAQAALGSLFVDLVRDDGKSFVIETHSDYIVDRIRQEVAGGRLPATQVAILYLEKVGNETTVYRLGLDENGNILGAPPSYRGFFLREEMNLLRRTSK